MDPNSDTSKKVLVTSVADSVSSLLGYWDKDQICRFANAAYLTWFGKRCRYMVGTMSMKEFLGANYEKNLPYILLALTGEPQTFESEVKVDGGHVRYVVANYYPDVVEGKVRGFFAQIIDITKSKLLKKQLVASNIVVKDQNERLLNFANIVSHNLKTYAYNLREVLSLYKQAEDPDEREILFRYLENISTDFSSTVSNLDEITQAENQIRLPSQRINLFEVVSRHIDLLKIQIDESKVSIENIVDPDLIFTGNLPYLESIVLNLLTNGIKYSSPDKKAFIRVSAKRYGKEIIVRFEDNGVGIDLEKHQDKLFQIYQTFHGNSDAKGIGLYITRFQAESMGGRIEVLSALGAGSVFVVHLPEYE